MKVFRAPSLPVRVVALAVLLVVVAAALIALAAIADFPTDYGTSQSDGACALAVHSAAWSDFVDGTTTDPLVYIPGYVALSLVAVAVTSRKPRGERFRRVFEGGLRSDGFAVAVVLALGVADVAETLLFRRTLVRLQAGTRCADLLTATDVTRVFTTVKWTLFAVLLVVVCWRVVARPATYSEADPSASTAR